jgi:hypothetical protein
MTVICNCPILPVGATPAGWTCCSPLATPSPSALPTLTLPPLPMTGSAGPWDALLTIGLVLLGLAVLILAVVMTMREPKT